MGWEIKRDRRVIIDITKGIQISFQPLQLQIHVRKGKELAQGQYN